MDSFPPSEREWLLKQLRESEQRITNKMLMLSSEFKGVEERLDNVELQFMRTGKRATVNASLNSGAVLSAVATVLYHLVSYWGGF